MLILMAAAASLAAADEQDYAGAGDRPARCLFDLERGAMTLAPTSGEVSVAAGESAQIAPHWTPYPGAWDPVPHRCLSGWRASDQRLSRLSRDRRTLTIARDAPAGTLINLTARYRGREVNQAFRVIVPLVSPLIGTWRQRSEDCGRDTVVTELVFRRTGEFSVTFTPLLHNSVEYRGRWRSERDRLILSDIATASGRIPTDFIPEAIYAIDPGGALTFSAPWHGTMARHGTCAGAFRRS